MTHLPTGRVVFAREERSQHRNRALAIARLAAALAEESRQAQKAAERERWARHDSLERGNEIRAYQGEQFRRLK